MIFSSLYNRLSPAQSLMISAGLLTSSALLLWLHAQAVADMREVGLPAALALPQVEQRIAVLKEQNDIAQLQASLRGGSQEEMINVYVLPKEADTDRLLAMFDVLFNWLEQKHQLTSFSAVTVGSPEDGKMPVSFDAVLTQEGLSNLMLFADLSGLLTVSDALSQEDIQHLLALTEQENPSSVAALEHFLSTGLLDYALEPRPYEEQLRKSFSTQAEPLLRSVLDGSRVRHARELLKDLGATLRKQNLWPLRLLTVEKATIEAQDGGMVKLEIRLDAYTREN